jgi:hypothetical protein
VFGQGLGFGLAHGVAKGLEFEKRVLWHGPGSEDSHEMATPGKSAREIQEEIERALAARQRSSSLRGWWVRIAAVAVATVLLTVFAAWATLVVLHAGNGASISDAARMTLDNLRVAKTCPTDLDTVFDFLTRSETLPFDGLTDLDASEAASQICSG